MYGRLYIERGIKMVKELLIYDLAMAQELCRMGHVMTFAKRDRVAGNNKLIFCFQLDETVEDDFEMLKDRLRRTGSI